MRAEAGASDRIAAAPETPDVLAVAAALRWERPDLTGQLADHVLGAADALGDRDRWLQAAGWAVHARSAIGDGRPTASSALEGLRRWGASALSAPAAHRLRVELAVVAIGTGQTDRARSLLAPVLVMGNPPLLRADARAAVARCAVEDAPGEVMSELRNARAAWSEVTGAEANLGLAAIELVAAAAHRRAGRPEASAAAATAGLTRLRGRLENGLPGTPSSHLAAALTTEWISALLDTGRVDEAQDGCEPLFTWLGEPLRPCRQLARLRLTVARALAPGVAPQVTADALARAARDAADTDAPDLEVVSRSALAALLQQLGQREPAAATLRVAEQAERRDKQRDRLFRAVLGAATVSGADARVTDRAAVATAEPTGPPPVPAAPLMAAPGPGRGGPTALGSGLDRGPLLPPMSGTGPPDRTEPRDRTEPPEWSPIGPLPTSPAQQWPWTEAPIIRAGDDVPTPPAASAATRCARADQSPAAVDATAVVAEQRQAGTSGSDRSGGWPANGVAPPPDDAADAAGGADVNAEAKTEAADAAVINAPGAVGAGGATGAVGVALASGATEAIGTSPPSSGRGGERISLSWPPLPGAGDTAAQSTSSGSGLLQDWPWAGRLGESPIGDLLMARLRANREAAAQRGGLGAHHGPDDGPDGGVAEPTGGDSEVVDPRPPGRVENTADLPATPGPVDDRPRDAGAPVAAPPAGDRLPNPDRSPDLGGPVAASPAGSPDPVGPAASPPVGGRLPDPGGAVAASPAGGRSLGSGGPAASPPVGGRLPEPGGPVAPGPDGDPLRDPVGPLAVSPVGEGPPRPDGQVTPAPAGERALDAGLASPGAAAAPSRSRRTPVDDPWKTGLWAGADRFGNPRESQAAAPDDGGGRSGTAGRAGPAAGLDPATGGARAGMAGEAEAATVPEASGGVARAFRPATPESPSPRPREPVSEPDSRFLAALDDLDRAWNLATGDPNSRAGNPIRSEPIGPGAEGCRIVVDVARDGRRFAGPRAAAVLRTVAGRLHLQLPAGASLGADDQHGLTIRLPATGHLSATSWMHHTLPALLDDLTVDDDLARLHLRSVVYGSDGPLGAQLLVRLDRAVPPSRPVLDTPVGNGGDRPTTWPPSKEAGSPLATPVDGLGAAAPVCGCPPEVAAHRDGPVPSVDAMRSGSPGPLGAETAGSTEVRDGGSWGTATDRSVPAGSTHVQDRASSVPGSASPPGPPELAGSVEGPGRDGGVPGTGSAADRPVPSGSRADRGRAGSVPASPAEAGSSEVRDRASSVLGAGTATDLLPVTASPPPLPDRAGSATQPPADPTARQDHGVPACARGPEHRPPALPPEPHTEPVPVPARLGAPAGRPAPLLAAPGHPAPGDAPAADSAGRHDATGRTPFRPSGAPRRSAHGDQRHRLDPDAPVTGVGPGRPDLADTDGLGLADLLAGALAAYRGI